MQVSMVSVNKIFKTYKGQERIAELNSKNPVKRAQGQLDRVSISNEARTAELLMRVVSKADNTTMMFKASPPGDSSQSVSQKAEARSVETAEFKPDNFEQNAK